MAKASKWDDAIADAQAKLSGLHKAIRYYRQMKKMGEPWPNEKGGFLWKRQRREGADGTLYGNKEEV